MKHTHIIHIAMRRAGFILVVFLLGAFGLFAQEDSVQPFAFAVIGDNGCGCKAQDSVAKRMLEWYSKRPFSTVIMLGDNIYGTGSVFEFWKRNKKGGHPDLFKERFDIPYKPLLDRGVKFYAALGNHDYEHDNAKSMIADKARFNIQGDQGYYSFEPENVPSGLITFFVLNTIPLHRSKGDPEQVEWLKEALSDSDSIWKIVYYHHPMYTAEGSHSVDHKFRLAVEQIFIDNQVKVTFAGHNHFYSRMKPIGGIMHITAGGGGRYSLEPVRGMQTDKISDSYHFMYVEAYPDRLEFWAIPPIGPPIDQGKILRNDPGSPDFSTNP